VLFVYVCVKYLVFRAAPPLPPSPEEALRLQAEGGSESFFLGVRKLLKNRGFILVLMTYGLAVALINSLSTLLNELILTYFPVCMCAIEICIIDA
jgi:FLVCR family feline leukemia virus subgroup C receptor-related protein